MCLPFNEIKKVRKGITFLLGCFMAAFGRDELRNANKINVS